MTFLRAHWLPLALLMAAVFFGIRSCAEARASEAANARAEEAEQQAVEWRGRATADSLALVALEAEAARADTVYIARVDTFRLRDSVWLALPDTAGVETVRAVADSTITACRSALDSCALARAASQHAFVQQTRLLADVRGEAEALRDANAALRDGLEPSSILPTVVLTAGGCGLGYALEGFRGCGIGAGIGLSADIAYRGIRSLLESVR